MGKIFCRIYQGIMKIGMYFLPWKMPEVLEGAGCIRRLPAVIRQKGYKNVLIVTDAMLVKAAYDSHKFPCIQSSKQRWHCRESSSRSEPEQLRRGLGHTQRKLL